MLIIQSATKSTYRIYNVYYYVCVSLMLGHLLITAPLNHSIHSLFTITLIDLLIAFYQFTIIYYDIIYLMAVVYR